uniref:RRM domain-containing protein n=1 Tax=Arcella intermedia TaxID=1963864 RepID=A0A6B2LFI3_9EUKA
MFGFCGYVSGLNLSKDPNSDNQVAIVEFFDKAAVTTACLLSSAVIQGQAIQVELYVCNVEEQDQIATEKVTSSGPAPPATGDPAAKQSKTAVMARLAVSGYVLAGDVKNKAIAWDSGNLSIVQKLEALGSVALSQAGLINERYHLTDKKDEFIVAAEKKATELKTMLEAKPQVQSAIQKGKEIDQAFGISSTASSLFQKAKSVASKVEAEAKAEYAKQTQHQPASGAPPPLPEKK